jgi:mannose-1-phosphate guanylyltransferase/mannose-6-phosphate isomerase
LLALDGDDPRTLLRATYDRVARLADGGVPWVIASRAVAAGVRATLPRAARRRIVLEPTGKNTAAAAVLAAAVVEEETKDGVVVLVPADHHVAPLAAYRAALAAMLDRAAKAERILTLGLSPAFPATGYGYLEIGRRVDRSIAGPVHVVERFVEKPPLARAKRYLAGGRHLWNGGTFAFRPRVMFAAVARHAHDVDAATRPVRGGSWRRGLEKAYADVPSISIDYAVMEKAKGLVETVAARLDWDDLGSFDAVARHAARDADGNVLPEGAVAVDAKDCFARADDGTLVALLGVSGVTVVRTKDAVLVAAKGRGEDVRDVVERLRREGRRDLLA